MKYSEFYNIKDKLKNYFTKSKNSTRLQNERMHNIVIIYLHINILILTLHINFIEYFMFHKSIILTLTALFKAIG